MALGVVQEKVLAQLEAEGKLTKDKKPKKAAAAAETDAKKGKVAAEEEEEEEDPVEAELTKYGIITENPWEKGVKCVPHFCPHGVTLCTDLFVQICL